MSSSSSSSLTSKNDLQTLGVFSFPSILSKGDPYHDIKDVPDSRYKGKQFLSTGRKKGQGPDVLMSTFEHKADPFYDNYDDMERKQAMKKNKNIKPFIPASGSKKSSGMGSTYGLLDKKYEYYHDEYIDNISSVRDRKKRKSSRRQYDAKGKRNFVVNPPKKGGFGYEGTLIGGTTRYESDPYQDPSKLLANLRKSKVDKDRPPFVTTTRKSSDVFDKRVFSEDTKTKKMAAKKKTKKKKKKKLKPYVPSGKSKSTISNFPSHISEPYNDPITRFTIDKKKKSKFQERHGDFKPASATAVVVPTRSIVMANIGLSKATL